MKNLKISLAFTFLFLMMLTFSCKDNTKDNQTETTKTEQTSGITYQCPMKCEGEKTYDKPGSCPVCNMDLEATEASEEHHDSH